MRPWPIWRRCCCNVRPTISPKFRRRWMPRCTAIAERKPPSKSRCTILSVAPPGGRSMRCSAAKRAAASRCLRSSAPRRKPPICARRRNAGRPVIARSRSRSGLLRPKRTRRARGRYAGCSRRGARNVSSRPTPIRALASTRLCVTRLRSAIAVSTFSSSRCGRTISTPWRALRPRAASRSAPMRAFIRITISSVITRAMPPRA